MTDSIDKPGYLTQQWLGEIQSLKQQMIQLQRERDEAWESSQKWRQLYNTEAEQRRAEARMHQQAIASLKTELQKFQGINYENLAETNTRTAIEQEISKLSSLEELQDKVITLTQERDRLLLALKTEQTNHEQTRKSLTTALGDAIDSLAKARVSGKEVEEIKEQVNSSESETKPV